MFNNMVLVIGGLFLPITGLRRCSKSCRLRWTNYLRPGIKRGSFTDHEEKMIIQLQALLGNKWAAIASYLPERTDNDIKNYWNTHLKKKLKKLQTEPDDHFRDGFSSSHSISRGQWERRLQTDINLVKQALHEALSQEKPNVVPELKPSNGDYSYNRPAQASTYASSTENIARLLRGWKRNPPNCKQAQTKSSSTDSMSSEETPSAKKETSIDLSEAFESLFGFESLDSSNSDFSRSMSPEASLFQDDQRKPDHGAQVPLSMLEKWLFDESTVQGKEVSSNFSFNEGADLF
ncbi:hypothetical protein F0562_004415 [Nyssa sinensis]|uniref:HTH myb-type domain-containing protein n=1 Tax=Nyssa sinensis TaxID=561372 RepID=A0A5J5BZB1_9ASTE|nr:hypothetical protein F0562_004415 [Nyssa sinensis]